MTDEAYKKFPEVVIDDDKDRLEQIMDWQLELQTALYGVHPADMEMPDRIQFIWTMHTAALDEHHELMAEVGWKPWASARFINVKPARGELIDILHFVISEALALGMTPQMLFEMYAEKQERNRARQRKGYSGVDEKCIVCKRDVQDVKIATGRDPIKSITGPELYCGQCGRGMR